LKPFSSDLTKLQSYKHRRANNIPPNSQWGIVPVIKKKKVFITMYVLV